MLNKTQQYSSVLMCRPCDQRFFSRGEVRAILAGDSAIGEQRIRDIFQHFTQCPICRQCVGEETPEWSMYDHNEMTIEILQSEMSEVLARIAKARIVSPVEQWLNAHLRQNTLSLCQEAVAAHSLWTVECHDDEHTLDWNGQQGWPVLEIANTCEVMCKGSTEPRLKALCQLMTRLIRLVEKHRTARKSVEGVMENVWHLWSEAQEKLTGKRPSIKNVVLPRLQAVLEQLQKSQGEVVSLALQYSGSL